MTSSLLLPLVSVPQIALITFVWLSFLSDGQLIIPPAMRERYLHCIPTEEGKLEAMEERRKKKMQLMKR